MVRPTFLSKVDPFMLGLMVAVILASVLPVRGAAAPVFAVVTDLAIALLFFLHGAKLSRDAVLQGLGNWRLHALVLGVTFVLFPSIGLLSVPLLSGWLAPLLVTGVLFLTLLPSTVQSSIAFTGIARGNVAAAVCSASLSNLLGIAITPLLVGLFIQSRSPDMGFDWAGVRSIVVQLLLPFIFGHLLRPVIGGWVDKNKKILTPVDRSSILLVVYGAFSAAVVNGIWGVVGPQDLLLLVVISAVILAVVMAGNTGIARAVGLPREDAIVLMFCGSKKSLASGVPIAGALFAPAQVGVILLPVMIFHQLQLFVCAWLATRYANDGVVARVSA